MRGEGLKGNLTQRKLRKAGAEDVETARVCSDMLYPRVVVSSTHHAELGGGRQAGDLETPGIRRGATVETLTGGSIFNHVVHVTNWSGDGCQTRMLEMYAWNR